MSKTIDPRVQKRIDELRKMGEDRKRRDALESVPPPRDLSTLSNIIKVENLTVAYRRKSRKNPELNDVSFNVRETELILVLGQSGHGKSTLIRLLAGDLKKVWSKSGTINANDQKKKVGGIRHPFKSLHKMGVKNIQLMDEDDHHNQGHLGPSFRSTQERKKKATIVVSHQDIPNIFNHADRVAYMHKGKMVWLDTPLATLKAYQEGTLPKPFSKHIEEYKRLHDWDIDLSYEMAVRPTVSPLPPA